jgi:four helix bundle protein
MFDFQKLEVYAMSKNICKDITHIMQKSNFDRVTYDQLRRASFSIMLNIAEGSSRFTNKDRRYFLIMARGSVFECVAILEYLSETNEISAEKFKELFARFEEISKILFSLIRKLNDNN